MEVINCWVWDIKGAVALSVFTNHLLLELTDLVLFLRIWVKVSLTVDFNREAESRNKKIRFKHVINMLSRHNLKLLSCLLKIPTLFLCNLRIMLLLIIKSKLNLLSNVLFKIVVFI